MEGDLICVTSTPSAFHDWLKKLVDDGMFVEVVINKRYVMAVHVKEPDNGDWSQMEYGSITSANGLWFKQNVYRPAMVKGKFVYNYNGKRKEI